jgi:hypothetical protein
LLALFANIAIGTNEGFDGHSASAGASSNASASASGRDGGGTNDGGGGGGGADGAGGYGSDVERQSGGIAGSGEVEHGSLSLESVEAMSTRLLEALGAISAPAALLEALSMLAVSNALHCTPAKSPCDSPRALVALSQ